MHQQIQEGNLRWTVRQMRRRESFSRAEEGMSEAEWSVIRDLELAQKYMGRLRYGLIREGLLSEAFHARALLLVEGLLDGIEVFEAELRSFHERRAHQGNRQNAL